jgi:hypothetical protein
MNQIYWVPGLIQWGRSLWGLKLTIQLHLILKFGVSRAVPAVPYVSLQRAQGKIYCTLIHIIFNQLVH